MIKTDQAIAPVDITTDRTGSYVAMRNYRQVQALVTTATVPTDSVVTVQLLQAQDDSGTGEKALSAVVSQTAASGGEAITLTVEANASDLDDGFTHVTAQVTCDDDAAVNGAALLIRANGRYGTSEA